MICSIPRTAIKKTERAMMPTNIKRPRVRKIKSLKLLLIYPSTASRSKPNFRITPIKAGNQ
jgi:hypothetical protein